ncbi:MmpS family transport accessory protein [Lentzea sp. HUAS12]|uniref:MmpS family transport accessory protein n=1 Tax=Lentzea sp. HUAS12 TaxID=2951806 RepID=UPI00209E5E7A|nr:MmpS family transport accessory protein [Lentzea sp. HUAS12]USX49940.1 MmpS family protein [Lentzea sp. HUAS12]
MSYPQPPQGPQQPYQQQYPQPMPPGQPQYFAPPPPQKKAKKWPWVIGAIFLLIIISSVANGGKSPEPTTSAGTGTTEVEAPAAVQKPAPAAKKTVVYEVGGAGTANNITYTTDGMTSIQQEGDVKLPWSKTIELPTGEALQMVSVMAQAGKGTPEITVKITVDGKVVKEGKSSGQYAVVNVNENIGTLGK